MGVAMTEHLYPEHEKLHEILDKSQTIGEFLDIFLPSKGIVLAEREHGQLWPTHRSIPKLLAEFFDIDQSKIDAEKEQMLAAMREANAR